MSKAVLDRMASASFTVPDFKAKGGKTKSIQVWWSVC